MGKIVHWGQLFVVIRICGLGRLFVWCDFWFLCSCAFFGLLVALYTSCILLIFTNTFTLIQKTKKKVHFPSWWVTGEGWNFRRISGAGPHLCVFPFLFALAISKEVRVKDVWNPSVVWSPSFSRHFNNWEVDYVERFLLSLHEKSV